MRHEAEQRLGALCFLAVLQAETASPGLWQIEPLEFGPWRFVRMAPSAQVVVALLPQQVAAVAPSRLAVEVVPL